MYRLILISITVFALLVVMLGCDDRGTNLVKNDIAPLSGVAGLNPDRDHVYLPQLSLQIRNFTNNLLLGSAYIPVEAISSVQPNAPVPFLVLLAPENGDKFHYFRAGLEQVAKELTLSGEIQPMVIICIGNDPLFGGFFYANNVKYPVNQVLGNTTVSGFAAPSGNYDDIIGKELIPYIHNNFDATIQNPRKRGIGGIGQGAYGAFRAVLKNPGAYGSISVADGPLDFDGSTGNGGLIPLFQQSLSEQLAHYTDTIPFNFRKHYDSSMSMPISQMLIGGALAFSPNDTLVTFTLLTKNPWVTITNRLQRANGTVGDSTTLIRNVIGTDKSGKDFDFHLPFDASGVKYDPIWSLWMKNNLDSLYTSGALDSVNIWVGSNPEAHYNYYDQTQSWIAFMESKGLKVEEYKYGTFENGPLERDEYLFDLLKKMLIFHSDSFGE